MFLRIPAFHNHMCPMRQWDTDHPIHMVHIDASNIISRERVVEQGEIPKIPSLEPRFSICFGIPVFLLRNSPHFISPILSQQGMKPCAISILLAIPNAAGVYI
jgi:hypothetical protein